MNVMINRSIKFMALSLKNCIFKRKNESILSKSKKLDSAKVLIF